MNVKNLIINKVDEIHTNYNENIALKTGIVSIPYIGGALDVLFSQKGYKIMNKRIKSAFQKVKEEAQKLDQSKIDSAFLETEEFFDIVYRTFDEVRKTRLDEKHLLFVKILTKSTYNNIETEKIELYQNMLAELSPNEFKVALFLLSNIKQSENDDYKTRKEFWDHLQIKGLSSELIKDSITRLFSLGLLSERYGVILGYSGGHYVINNVLKEFLNYLMGDGE